MNPNHYKIAISTLKEVYREWISDSLAGSLAERFLIAHSGGADRQELINIIWMSMPGGGTAGSATDLILSRIEGTDE